MPRANRTKLSDSASQSAAALYPAWRRIGINFTGESATEPVDLEQLVINTARLASTDERLTVCAASWLARFHDLVDGRRLSELTRGAPPRTRTYLGAILSFAIEAPHGARHAPQFETALSHCKPMSRPQPFYDAANQLQATRTWMQQHTVQPFSRWRLWHDDLSLQLKSVHTLERVLRVPELRARAIMGPSLEADCMALTLDRVTNARALSLRLGVTYAATHAAIERLVGRGLLTRLRNGVRQELRLSDLGAAALRP